MSRRERRVTAEEIVGEGGRQWAERSLEKDESDGQRGRRGRRRTRAGDIAGEGGSKRRKKKRASAEFRKINEPISNKFVWVLC